MAKCKAARVVGFICLIVLALLFVTLPLIAEDGINGNLVKVNWLEKNLNNANVVILDASPSQIYTTKHIPGAISYDIFTYGVQELPVAEIEKRYQSWGISLGKKIVMYDQGGTILATRLFFSLYYYGFPSKDLFILDGGFSKWEDAGYPVTNESAPAPKKGSFTITNLNEDAKSDLPEFLTASGDMQKNVLLEALNPSWHFGGLPFFSKPGHIPNAISLPSDDFFNPDKTFKSPEEISNILTYLGITPNQNIYTHCGGGIAASVPFFALKFLMNYQKVKLFIGSQLEWISDQRDLPIWTYDAPYLMRETKWLQFWGGQKARMYGISNLTIVDVRSADEFNRGHIPFAINIPSDVFKNNIIDLGKLASIFGSAGLNPNYEAVIFSGAGLTKESALAFALLDMLGQKKLSVFIDSIDKWTQLGNSILRDSTIAGSQKNTQVVSVSSSAYPESIHTGIFIRDPESTHGFYPKVFIASGKDVSYKSQEDKVVHIPYTALLNTDGTPKEAKDIWKILSEAGVPRYAELVCFSDDLSEAASNYFILKLMGYPDIKVLVI